MDMNLSKLWERVEDREAWRAPWGHKRIRHDLATEYQQQYLINVDFKTMKIGNMTI